MIGRSRLHRRIRARPKSRPRLRLDVGSPWAHGRFSDRVQTSDSVVVSVDSRADSAVCPAKLFERSHGNEAELAVIYENLQFLSRPDVKGFPCRSGITT